MHSATVISDIVIDDIIALALLNKLGSHAAYCLVSTFGNIPEEAAFRNAQEFVKLATPHWKLVRGAVSPVSGTIEHQWLTDFNGPDGVWGVHPQVSGPQVTVQSSSENNARLLSLASLTEVWRLLQRDRMSIKSLTVMGGAFDVPGNLSRAAECNIGYDPDAAKLVFTNCQDIDVKVIPLNVTRNIFWEESLVDDIGKRTELNSWLKQILKEWYKQRGRKTGKSLKMHDPTAVFLDTFPDYAVWKTSGVDVVLSGSSRGKTIVTPTNPPCRIAVGIRDGEKLRKDMYEYLFM